MLGFIFLHLPDNCARTLIGDRQLREMTGKMRLDLAFRLDKKPQTDRITHPARDST